MVHGEWMSLLTNLPGVCCAVLEWFMQGLSQLQPYVMRVVDSIAKARSARGDAQV